MSAPVTLCTIHHQGAGAPTDNSSGYSDGGYTYGIGATRWERFRDVWDSYATLNFNGESVDVCLSGDRHTGYTVTDEDIERIRGALADARARGYIVDAPTVRPHSESPGSATACPGDYTRARWDEIVAACHAGSSGGGAQPKGGGAVAAVCTPSGNGYYVADSTGAVFAYGDAKYRGGPNTIGKLDAPIVGIDVTKDNGGYVLAGADGGTFAYGNANNGRGAYSMGAKHLAAPVVAVQLTPQNDGLWLFAADGGIFAFGGASFHGAPTGKVH